MKKTLEQIIDDFKNKEYKVFGKSYVTIKKL